jgi:hypothetical protein
MSDDREIRIHTPADITQKRTEIIRAIWNADKLPDRADVIVTKNVKSPLNPCSALARVDKIEIPARVVSETPVKDLAYLFVPVHRNKRLILFCPGHSCTLKTKEVKDQGIESTITALVNAGFDVLSVYMPHVSENNCDLDHCKIYHSDLGLKDPLPTYGMRLFLEPTIVSLNYLLKKYKYNDVNMVGLSGGGWTTNLISAIDDRVKMSFSIAGSTPVYHRYKGSIGDIEQFLPELYRDIAGYPDLYILGAYGKGRKQVQVLNRNDDCCFGVRQHDPARNYDTDMRTYEQTVINRLISMGAPGHYYLVIDETAPCHQISEFTIRKIILPQLSEL